LRRVSFNLALALIALAGVGARLLYVKVGAPSRGPGDPEFYHQLANALADGHGFRLPVAGLFGPGSADAYSGETVPTAFHPPLFPALLAVFSELGFTGYGSHRAIGCVLGGATVAVVGLAGRHVGGPRLGLVAAGLAAVYLPLIANESVLMSESLYGLTVALTILAALRYAEAPSPQRAALLGAAIGAAVLTRSEAILLLVLLVPFAARKGGTKPLRATLVAAAATALVVAPWCVRNTLVFDQPVGVTTGDGAALAGSNTRTTYYGDGVGTWDFGGLALGSRGRLTDEVEHGKRLREKGLRYARDNAGRLPAVIAARVGRTWMIYPLDPRASVRYNAYVRRRRPALEWAGLLSAWVVTLLAIPGALLLRRRGAWLVPLLAPIALVTIVSVLIYGTPRFREAADVALVILAAAALIQLRPAGRWDLRAS
jgi:hypothetical protein